MLNIKNRICPPQTMLHELLKVESRILHKLNLTLWSIYARLSLSVMFYVSLASGSS